MAACAGVAVLEVAAQEEQAQAKGQGAVPTAAATVPVAVALSDEAVDLARLVEARKGAALALGVAGVEEVWAGAGGEQFAGSTRPPYAPQRTSLWQCELVHGSAF